MCRFYTNYKNILRKTSIHQKQRADHVTSSWNLISSAVKADQDTSRQETNIWGISCLIQDSKEVTEMTRTYWQFKLINYLLARAGKFHFNLWLYIVLVDILTRLIQLQESPRSFNLCIHQHPTKALIRLCNETRGGNPSTEILLFLK